MSQVIIPAAGMGSRFYPYTKIIPKELLAFFNRPAIDYIIDECNAANHNDIIIIINEHKLLIKKYLTEIKQQPCSYLYQSEPRGLGHAILQAAQTITSPFFGISLPDDLIFDCPPVLGLMQKISNEYHSSVIAVQEVAYSKVSSYGIIKPKYQLTDALFEVEQVIEKPAIEQAPSRYAIVGRYWLSHHIFNSLNSIAYGAHQELQLTDALKHMIQQGQKVLAFIVPGIRHDIGTPSGLVQALVERSLHDKTLAPALYDTILQSNYYLAQNTSHTQSSHSS